MARSLPADPLHEHARWAEPHWRAFSLWCPSALHRLYVWLHLANDALELVTRRVAVVVGLAWLPLLFLSAIAGRVSRNVNVPFAMDLDLQARILVALPLLIAGEVVVHRRMPITVRQFVERRIITGAARVQFEAAMSAALKLSRSPLTDLVLLGIVYAVGVSLTGSITSLPGTTWYGTPVNGLSVPTAAGWWYIAVSRPLFQFILLRWYFRFFVWNRFLWQVSRIRLQVAPTHPDRRCGIGFIFGLSDAFLPFLVAHGAMLAGRVGNGVLYAGLTLYDYELELAAIPALAVLLVLLPELTFAPLLWRLRRKGSGNYGRFAQRYMREFDHKWIQRPTPAFTSLLGTPDIQSLSDLVNAYDTIKSIRVFPSRDTVMMLLAATILPLAPLPLTVISGRELLERLVKIML